MATVFKHKDIRFEKDAGRIEHYRMLTSSPRFASVVNPENLFFDLRLLEPGQFSYPYHFHMHAEELMMVISGSMTLRSEEGLEVLNQGDLVFFEMGKSGAHQFHNHTEEPCKYLDIRTFTGADVCEYPDSGKINIIPAMEIFEAGTKVEYFKGEEDVVEKWSILRKK